MWFLDEVFTAVSSEPHVYADITVDMQGEIAAVEARMAQSGVESLEWSLTPGTRWASERVTGACHWAEYAGQSD